MTLEQFPQTAGQNSSDRSSLGKTVRRATSAAGEPADTQDHLSYGIIESINFETYQVQVRTLRKDKKALVLNGAYLPLQNQLSDIFLRWGQPRKGMFCRVHWRGKSDPRWAMVEIIGDEEANFLKKKDRKNEVVTNPYKFLGGGMTSF